MATNNTQHWLPPFGRLQTGRNPNTAGKKQKFSTDVLSSHLRLSVGMFGFGRCVGSKFGQNPGCGGCVRPVVQCLHQNSSFSSSLRGGCGLSQGKDGRFWGARGYTERMIGWRKAWRVMPYPAILHVSPCVGIICGSVRAHKWKNARKWRYKHACVQTLCTSTHLSVHLFIHAIR